MRQNLATWPIICLQEPEYKTLAPSVWLTRFRISSPSVSLFNYTSIENQNIKFRSRHITFKILHKLQGARGQHNRLDVWFWPNKPRRVNPKHCWWIFYIFKILIFFLYFIFLKPRRINLKHWWWKSYQTKVVRGKTVHEITKTLDNILASWYIDIMVESQKETT